MTHLTKHILYKGIALYNKLHHPSTTKPLVSASVRIPPSNQAGMCGCSRVDSTKGLQSA